MRAYTQDAASATPAPVPGPSTSLLLATGGTGLLATGRRRRPRAA